MIHTIDLAGGESKPVGVVVSPDGTRIYVANGHAHSVSVIDATTLEEPDQIPVGRRPRGIAITPDGEKLYTANGLSNDVTVPAFREHTAMPRVGLTEAEARHVAAYLYTLR